MKSQIKKVFKQPLKLLRKILNRNNKQRKYETYQDALANCHNHNYESVDLVKVVVEKTVLFSEAINQDPTLDIGALRTLIAIGFTRKSDLLLRVLDFGGAAGYHYMIARKVLPKDVKLRWNVVETPAMVREAQKLASSELSFFDNINDAKQNLGEVDLTFTSSALHYCPDPHSSLQDLLSVNAKYLVITRTNFNDADNQLISVQKSYLSKNGFGTLPKEFSDRAVYYPNVFIPRSNVEIMLSDRYNICFKTIEEKATFTVGEKEIGMYGYFCTRKD